MEPEDRESAYRSYGGIVGTALMSVAILWVLFHVVTAGIGTLPNYQQRAIHLGGALALVFLLYPGARRDSALRRFGDLILAAIKDVQARAQERSRHEMGNLAESMGLPRDMNLPGL